jgi:hypothetical protein
MHSRNPVRHIVILEVGLITPEADCHVLRQLMPFAAAIRPTLRPRLDAVVQNGRHAEGAAS